MVELRRAYKFRAFPTRPQEGRAVRLLADHCDLYNAALMGRREAWQMQHVRIAYVVRSAQLKEIRREVGVDSGAARFLTTSDGELVANPRFLAGSAQVIADLERRKAQARPGSGNRKRIRRALGRRCERPQRKTVICPVHRAIDADVNGARNIASRAGLGSGQAPTAA